MNRHKVWACLAMVAAAGLLGSGPCNQGGLSESNHPLERYYQRMLAPGSVVNVFDQLPVYFGADLAPNTVSPFTVTLARDSDGAPISGMVAGFDFDPLQCGGNALVLELFSFVDWDLGATAGWVNIRFGGRDHRVQVPATVIPAGETLALYVAADGSSYFAIDDPANSNPHTHNMFDAACDFTGLGCPALTPPAALTATYFAAANSAVPSAAALTLAGNSIDAVAGLNGGLLASVTADQRVFVIAVDVLQPYWGFDQLNNTVDLMVGGFDSSGYLANVPFMVPPVALPCPTGIVFSPDNAGACDLNAGAAFTLTLNGLFLADGSAVPLTTIPFTTKALPAGFTPNYCLP